jgi:GT2 family glycosyltransferase
MPNSAGNPEVAVVIPLWRADAVFAETAASLASQTLTPVHTILIDNGESPLSLSIAEKTLHSPLVIRNPVNVGFAAAANQGIIAADAPFVCLLNQDCRLAPDYLEKVTAVLVRVKDAFAAGGLLRRDGETVDSGGHAFYRDRVATDIRVLPPTVEGFYEVWGLSATATVYRRTALFDLGPNLHPFDPLFFSYLEDVDLNYRARSLGLKSLLVPSAVAYHARASSGGRSRFAVRWRAHKNYLLLLVKYETAGSLLRDLPDLFPQMAYHLVESVFPNPLFLLSDLQLLLRIGTIRTWRRWYRSRARMDPVAHPLVRRGRWLREPLKALPGFPLSS